MKNQYLIGDNNEVLSTLTEKYNLIYFDPPYNTGRDFGDFNDKFKTTKEYRDDFIRPRIEKMYYLLEDDGVMVIHIDPTISHHFRLVMDDIFGEKNFINEVVWKSGGNKKSSKKLMRFHDTIIIYGKSKNFTYNPIYLPYDDEYKKNNTIYKDEVGEYTTSAAHNSQPGVIKRPNLRYEWNGNHKQWWWSKDRMIELENQNRLVYNKKGIPRVKKYLHEMRGIPVRDLWLDISQIQGKEKLDYATQKPVLLLERIIKLFTNKGDSVLDPFAGSGSVGRACINTERNYTLIDINEKGRQLFEESIFGNTE